MCKIALAATTERRSELGRLAQSLDLSIVDFNNKDFDFLLVLADDRLEFHEVNIKRNRMIYVDFMSGTLAYRKSHISNNELLARAVGLKTYKFTLNVLDCTAGFGNDAFVLASLGCNVLMLERSNIIVALVNDALERARRYPEFSSVKLNLRHVDGRYYLQQLDNKVDVIYLDPMYPIAKKTALAKKEMRILRAVVGDDLDAAALLQAALQKANYRVVVKRHRFAKFLGDLPPDVIFKGKSTRFDVYITTA